MSISENLNQVLKQIQENKTVDTVTLVAVSKYSEYDAIAQAYQAGQSHFGENRIDSLMPKALQAKELEHDIKWHFIGNIQSNKIREIASVPNLFAIHSIDSLKHLKKFYQEIQHPVKFFLQINTSDEEEKGGIKSEAELQDFLDLIAQNKNSPLEFAGLMTMGKLRAENKEAAAIECFSKLSSLRDQLEKSLDLTLSLSMGMSSDYIHALKAGADYLRVGSTIFK